MNHDVTPQGMLDEIRDLVSTSAAITSSTAATAPAAVASAMFSQIATEHRRQSRQAGYAKGGADVDDTREEVDDEAPDDVETRLRAEQEVSVAAVSSSVEAQKRELEMELERAGATAEEKEVGHRLSCRLGPSARAMPVVPAHVLHIARPRRHGDPWKTSGILL